MHQSKVGCGLFKHSPHQCIQSIRERSTAFTDHCFTVFTVGLVGHTSTVVCKRHKVNHGVVRTAEWCTRDGTVGTLDGCETMVKSSTIPSCTCRLLCELRHLFLQIGPIEITRHNNKRVWLRMFRQLNHCGALGGMNTAVRIIHENSL